jgi:hypothetical protein
MLERTVELKTKLEVAERQLSVAKRSKSSRKAEALEQQVESWNSTVAELEENVNETIMGVFMKRYRNKNKCIRADSLKSLSYFTLVRPDIFLTGYYLKYFGWLMSDKDACVRKAALSGMLEPFHEIERRHGKKSDGIKIDTSGMNSVIDKFLARMADCVLDVDIGVQEVAMELLLHLLRGEFFDDVDNERIWHQINMRAIAPDTSPSARRDALYFVIEQLQQFDSGSSSSENDAVERINALVGW